MKPRKMLYLIRCGDALKIGISKDPVARARAMQTSQPYEVDVLLAVWPGRWKRCRFAGCGQCARNFEGWVHRRLVEHHLRGEWFGAAAEAEARDLLQQAAIAQGLTERSPEVAEEERRRREEAARRKKLLQSGKASGRTKSKRRRAA